MRPKEHRLEPTHIPYAERLQWKQDYIACMQKDTGKSIGQVLHEYPFLDCPEDSPLLHGWNPEWTGEFSRRIQNMIFQSPELVLAEQAHVRRIAEQGSGFPCQAEGQGLNVKEETARIFNHHRTDMYWFFDDQELIHRAQERLRPGGVIHFLDDLVARFRRRKKGQRKATGVPSEFPMLDLAEEVALLEHYACTIPARSDSVASISANSIQQSRINTAIRERSDRIYHDLWDEGISSDVSPADDSAISRMVEDQLDEGRIRFYERRQPVQKIWEWTKGQWRYWVRGERTILSGHPVQ